MKLLVEKESLLIGLTAAQKAVATKTTMPMLECFHLIVKNDMLTISATDLELGIEYKLNVEVKEEGEVTVSAGIFSEIIRKLPESTVELSTNEQNLLIIECEGSLFNVVTGNTADFPVFPEVNVEQSIEIKQNVLKEMIRKTIFAVGIDESRPVFTGCLIEKKNDTLNMVALDGFRLALQTKVLINENSGDFKAIIPGRTLTEISKILLDTEDIVKIGVNRNQGIFEMPNCIAFTRVLEGEFLDYRQAIPKEKELRVIVDKNTLLSSLERAAVMSRDEKQLPVKITIADSLLIIQCAVQSGNVREEVIVESVGNNLEIGFNPKYLIDAVKAVDDGKIILDFGSSISPCVIRPENGEEYTYMVLPVRI